MQQEQAHHLPVAYAVGTGRCGTKLIAELMAKVPGVASHHERNPFNETFHRYCKWYGIPVDHTGFLKTKQKEAEADLQKAAFSFEASAHLSLSVTELVEGLGAKIILMVRAPHKVVASYHTKGWYRERFFRKDPSKPPSFQPDYIYPHHFLGRILPKGDFYHRWLDMTRVGKIAWYWATLNSWVLDAFKKLPPEAWRVQKLEELDYDSFLKILEFLGIGREVPRKKFSKIVAKKPNKSNVSHPLEMWNGQERQEFEEMVKSCAEVLGYRWETEELIRKG